MKETGSKTRTLRPVAASQRFSPRCDGRFFFERGNGDTRPEFREKNCANPHGSGPEASAEQKNCLVCGKPLEQKESGRPRCYCATACKRVAEYARRKRARRQGRFATVSPPRREAHVIPASDDNDVYFVDGEPVKKAWKG
jgi:predicted nucleic acid-binding Zn ribbon protein